MTYPRIDLDGASVAITGGGAGIGRAVAKLFASKGAHVAIGDLNQAAAEEAAELVGGTAHHLDVADRDSFASFVAATEKAHGPLHVLVNNAGLMPNGGFLELADATDRLQIDVNLGGVLSGMKLVLPGMVERGFGHVVNVASLAGKFPVKGLAVYNATKFAVVGLTAATRLEFADAGVSLTAVLPSAVDTALASGLDLRPIPKVQPEDVARAVVDSVHNRRAEIAVPGYVGLLATAARVTPEPVLNRIRRLVRDDRALHSDRPERSEYRANLEAQQGARR
ncbi:SDR family NAD(P)-dependent oxidoreductase [Amycolatopsis rubida]|uniref:SDR family NAD(P)-dependent oxidoreductase n=1 Tax=Amycolatopsis rubida TaxID=112413 RepID=A0ABX0BVC7_9PSEU|nr:MULTISPECIES: SDR family NAD(P)-dependent oxidoreductase [Amycolatopsis]MYW94337.1 SDR family NAD(P)-dependent oxidoreductase [Amycolatopsis rubida]NEC59326.1 SDR family NAD(P)-dependent oxidoreductase [Amycolatopsis rubida]OAP24728.1 putative oxidoreductase [Amycolatopsis sp. M39]